MRTTLSSVFKKDLTVLMYLVVFGGITLLSRKYLETGDASVLLGAAANYILYRIKSELDKEGYIRAIQDK